MKSLTSVTKDLKMTSRACLTGLLLTATSLSVFAGTIVGTQHDFSASGWSGQEICVACHTPHNSDTGVTDAPLWNHTVTTASYTLYTNPGTLNATTAQPSGVSKLCLSCHDGTVAIDSIVNSPLVSPLPATNIMSGDSVVGGDGLNNDHPISFAYNAALATADGALHDPTSTTTTIGTGTDSKTDFISEVMLFGANKDQVECATCHDVHNKFTDGGKLLRISNAGSGLCLTCHNK